MGTSSGATRIWMLRATPGCSQPTKLAPKWAAPIPSHPKSHNHCDEVLVALLRDEMSAPPRREVPRKMNRPWMPLYVGDYLGDTGHLTTTQHGAYLLLMMHYWRKGELPNDDRQLSQIAKLPLKTWNEYRATLQD